MRLWTPFVLLFWLMVIVPAFAQDAAEVPLHPNSQKYAEKTPSQAKGRSGTASLAARALVGKDGWTDVEMSTGDLDSLESGPGYISKAQIKVFDSLGHHVFTDNYNDLSSSYFSTQANYFRRGQPMQIHGNVKGTDGDGTEVVKVDITVKARPDLALEQLNHPDKAVIGTPVNIAATISERNGDVGARANCVLFVDGTEVDRALGIWVDSGDNVSCVFSHTFTSLGTRNLRVRVADVIPADWDEENNSGSSSIDVVNPDYDWASAAAGYTDYSSTVTTTGSYQGRTSGYDYVSTTTNSGWNQWANYRAYLFQALQFPVEVSAYLTDGTREIRHTFTNITPSGTLGNPEGYCSGRTRSVSVNGATVNLYVASCRLLRRYPSGEPLNPPRDMAVVDLARYAGATSYLSEGYQNSWYIWNGQTYTSRYTWRYNFGPGPAERWTGTTYSMDVGLTNDGRTYQTPLTVTFSHPYRSTYSNPLSCSTWTYPGSSGSSCYGSSGLSQGDYGSIRTPGPERPY